MTAIGWLQAFVVFGLVLISVKPLGLFMARVFSGERTFLSPVFVPVERAIYKLCRIDPDREMTWYTYLFAVLAFSAAGLAYLYGQFRHQHQLAILFG